MWAHIHIYTLTLVSNCACLEDCYSTAILHQPETLVACTNLRNVNQNWMEWNRKVWLCMQLSTASCDRELLVSKIRLLWREPMPPRGVHQCDIFWGYPTGLSANWDVLWQELIYDLAKDNSSVMQARTSKGVCLRCPTSLSSYVYRTSTTLIK